MIAMRSHFPDNSFAVVGSDASEGLLAEARRLHPRLHFRQETLPDLRRIEDSTNVLCVTIIMHLDHSLIEAFVKRLERFPLGWNHPSDKKSLFFFKELEHFLDHKSLQLLWEML